VVRAAPWVPRRAVGRGWILRWAKTEPVPEAKLFGHHWRDWVRKWVGRICEAAGVPKVTAHGMRGLHSTLAVEHGVSAHVVAASLGHESSATTIQSYVKPEGVSGAQQRRVMAVLEGGRLAS